jgi:hypothetical protein
VWRVEEHGLDIVASWSEAYRKFTGGGFTSCSRVVKEAATTVE